MTGSETATGSGRKVTLSRRTRRTGAETRAEILTTAETLFRQRGFQAVSIADIATHLGMSPANVFKHFRSKSLLVEAIAARHIENLAAGIAEDESSPLAENRLMHLARRLMALHLRNLQENPYVFEMMLMVAGREFQCSHDYRNLIVRKIENIVVAGVNDGIYAETDSQKTATTIMHALTCVLHPVLLASEDPDILATRCSEVIGLVESGLRNRLVR